MNETITEKLLGHLRDLKVEDLSSEVIDKAKLCLLDTLGVALAGSVTSLGKLAREYAVSIGGREENTIYNYGDSVSCIPGSYANGTMASCHNLSDTTLSCIVHCGPVIVPTALSIAEKEGNSGEDVLAAIVAGYDMMTRIANVINSGNARMSHHKRGFHATATTGVFGASLTASRLLNLNTDQTVDALGIAGSYASGLLESGTFSGTETWKTHSGIAAQNGISAALLAKLGLGGPSTILEGKQGFFSAFAEKDFDLMKMEEDLGKRFLILDSSFKLHNCPHVWAIPLDCLSKLAERYQIRPDDISEIKVAIPKMYSYVMDESKGGKYPRNYAEAWNNLPYVMAAMMIHGAVFLDTFSESVLRDPRMKRIASKVAIEIDTSLDEIFKRTDRSPAQVKLQLRKGKEVIEAADYPRGSPKNPATREEIERKFVDLAVNAFEKEKALEIVHIVNNIEKLTNMEELISHLMI
jgi:2-methylcitrate dehydratase PrpD